MECTIVSSVECIFSDKVKSLVVTATEGDLGIHPGHTPLLTALKPGPVHVIDAKEEEHVLYVSGGFLEVQPKKVNILADTVIRSDELDEKKIAKAKQDVQVKLRGSNDIVSAKLLAELTQLNAQLRTLQHSVRH